MTDETREDFTNLRSKLSGHTPVEIVLTSASGQHFYSSMLVDFDDDSFFLLPPRKGKAEIGLKDGDKIKVVYPAVDAIYEFDTTVIGFRMDAYGEREYQCAIPRKGIRIQRREFYRLPMTLNAQYCPVTQENEDGVDSYVLCGDLMPCMIDNISGGGVSVYMNTQFEIGDLFQVEFILELEERNKHFKEVIKIARDKSPKDKPLHGAYEFCYGGYFVDMSESEQSDIIRYILKKQIEFFGRGRK